MGLQETNPPPHSHPPHTVSEGFTGADWATGSCKNLIASFLQKNTVSLKEPLQVLKALSVKILNDKRKLVVFIFILHCFMNQIWPLWILNI